MVQASVVQGRCGTGQMWCMSVVQCGAGGCGVVAAVQLVHTCHVLTMFAPDNCVARND